MPPIPQSAIRNPQSRPAFTLIELLVVVTIIVVLLSILLPTVSRTLEQTRRATCLSHMRNVVQGATTYASEYFGTLPISTTDLANDSTNSFDLRKTVPLTTVGSGLGLLVETRIVPLPQAGLFVCPSFDTSLAVGTPCHGMDVNQPNWWNGMGVSFWTTPGRRIIHSYNYRSSSWFIVNGTQLRLGSTAGTGKNPRIVLYVDGADSRFGINYDHLDGYNRIFVDGGGAFFRDPMKRIDGLTAANGSFDGRNNTTSDEYVFDQLAY